jgi:hypothetical protein
MKGYLFIRISFNQNNFSKISFSEYLDFSIRIIVNKIHKNQYKLIITFYYYKNFLHNLNYYMKFYRVIQSNIVI